MDGKRLALIRKKRGLKQAEAAALIEQSQSHYSRYERNLIDPTSENLKKICLALDVSPEYLLDMVDYPSIDPFGGEVLTPDEAELVSNYRKASDEGKNIVLSASRAASVSKEKDKENSSSTEKRDIA